MGLFFLGTLGDFVLLICADLLCVLVLVERSELDERTIGSDVLPVVEADDKAVNAKEEVVVRLLKGLCDGVKLALVGAAVVGLRLARDRADEVGVDAHGKAHHVDRLDDVRGPVASLLVRLYFVDDHIVLLLAVR